MAFTAAELANIANAALDHYIKGPALAQSIQARPLYDAMKKASKSFAGGKGAISIPVKGDYTTSLSGYTHDDTVSYSNPANIKRAEFDWYELHAGIELTLTELKHDGISVVDSMNSEETSEHSQVELVRLTGLLEDKLDDMFEGWARSFNDMLWRDGTQDSLAIPGIQALLSETPTTGTVGGLSRSSFDWWRNRASLSIDSSTPSNQNLVNALHTEMRQLRRYGGRPNLALAGADFLDALGEEIREKGNYTEQGFRRRGDVNIGMAEVSYNGLVFQYDPTLDDLSKSKYCYILDSRHIKLYTMDGEDMKQHSPARPSDKYVMYRAVTYTGGLTIDQPNTCGVYSIA